MNTRIQELAERALEIVSNKRTLQDGQIERTWHPDYFNQVFAELIIKECANEIIDMADKYATFNGDHRRHLVHGAISEKLKEHFGVE